MSCASDIVRAKAKAEFVSLGVRVDAYASTDSSNFLKNAPKDCVLIKNPLFVWKFFLDRVSNPVPKDVAEMAFQILRIIASEAWVKEKCLSDGEAFVKNLLDTKRVTLTKPEAQLLIELVSHPDCLDTQKHGLKLNIYCNT